MSKGWIKYLVTISLGAVVSLIIVLAKNIFSASTVKEIFHILTDAFFVPGVVITGFGFLILATNGGTFDMLTYGLMRFFGMFTKNPTKYKTFYDYTSAKHETSRSFWYLVIVGIGYIFLSLLMLYFYYKY
ncbi:MAG: DUF3899 domain-containing protein [Bacilli bacterium]|nr:DUF3899 domain-containing protein [Bacillales bacterium]MDY2574545.1 DUF3899 domain-containing protein [Bacilli bacterium]